MKRILITGGAGFIGSHLCRNLIENGNEVLCLDNFHTGSKANIISLLDNPNFKLINHDVIHPFYEQVDEIYNLACPASPIHYQDDAIKTIKTNVLGTTNALGLAKSVKAKILQASTSEVYGSALQHPQNETYWGNVNPIGIRSCYDEGKRCAEALCMDYHRQNKVDVKIVRIFNTYGPNMQFNDGRVVSNFIIQALKGENITLYGNGTQTRSFQFVTDLISGLIKLMAKPFGYTGPVNIGNPFEITITGLANTIIDLTGSKSKLVYRDLPKDDPIRRKPDIRKAEKDLNWAPSVALEEGLIKTIHYFDKRIHSYHMNRDLVKSNIISETT